MPTTEYETIPVRSIKVTDRFRKDLGDLSELVASIQDKGVLQPLVVDPEFTLMAGGRRLEAAKQAGLLVVPVVIWQRNSASGIDPRLDALEIELCENAARKDFHWAERAALEQEIFNRRRAIDPKHQQKDHSEEMGQSDTTTSHRLQLASALEVFPELQNQPTERDAWKALKRMEEKIIRQQLVDGAASMSLKGTKIADSNYKVGDALEGMKGLRSAAYHFAEVDPPYAVDLVTVKTRKTKENNQNSGSYQEWSGPQYLEQIKTLATETYRVLADNSYVVWWHGADWYTETLAILKEAGFHVYNIPGIWYKGAVGENANPDQMLTSSYEQFFVARKGNSKLAKVARSNVFHYAPVPGINKIHPTEKPLELLEEILETFTFPGMRIVVPFLGSGVTLRACYKTGRIGFGWDLSEEHKQAFLARVAEDEMNQLEGV